MTQRLAKIKSLQDAPQIPQRSQEWYKNYSKVLTASEFSALFSQTKRRKDLVYSKVNAPPEQNIFRLACPTEEMNALGWGIRFEPVVKQLLEYRDKCKVFEPGRLQHPTNTHLAASPDGVIEQASHLYQLGRLVEIKCPYSRTIGGEIPLDYWIQMQIQMEVCDVDECEYIEATILSRKANQTEPVDLSGTTYQGILYLLENTKKPGDFKYIYGDVGSEEMPPLPQGYVWKETIPWGLNTWHRKIVSRDRAWYEATKPWQESFWNDVEKARNGEEFQTQTPRLKPVMTPCLIVDD
jgi:putative phage-type endonuclease